MRKYNGKYVKLRDDPTFWAVDKGKRVKVIGQEQMHKIGLRPVIPITNDELEAIPIKGETQASDADK